MSYQARLPEGLRDITKSLTKEILREKPKNIYEFAAQYFEGQMPHSDMYAVSAYEEPATYSTLLKSAGKHTQIPIALVYAIMPDRLIEFIKEFIKAVLKQSPRNICHFAVHYFRHMQKERPLELSPTDYEEYERYLKSKGRYAYPIKCTCGRWLGRASTISTGVVGECQETERNHLGKVALNGAESVQNDKSQNFKENSINVKKATQDRTEENKLIQFEAIQNGVIETATNPEQSTQKLTVENLTILDEQNSKLNGENSYQESHDKYLNAVHVIQRFLRKCLLRRKSFKNRTFETTSKPPEPMTDEVAALIIQRTLRKVFTAKKQQKGLVQAPASGLLTESLSQIDERSDISEATSYTSASTVLVGGNEDKDIRSKDIETLSELKENLLTTTSDVEDGSGQSRIKREAESIEKSIDKEESNQFKTDEKENANIESVERDNTEVSQEKTNEPKGNSNETKEEETKPVLSIDDTTNNLEAPTLPANEDKLAEGQNETSQDERFNSAEKSPKEKDAMDYPSEEHRLDKDLQETTSINENVTEQVEANLQESYKPLPDFREKYLGNSFEHQKSVTDIENLEKSEENLEKSQDDQKLKNDVVDNDLTKDQDMRQESVTAEMENEDKQIDLEVTSGNSDDIENFTDQSTKSEGQQKDGEACVPDSEHNKVDSLQMENEPKNYVEESKMVMKLVQSVGAVQSINNILDIGEEELKSGENALEKNEDIDTNNKLTTELENPSVVKLTELESAEFENDIGNTEVLDSTAIKTTEELISEEMPKPVFDENISPLKSSTADISELPKTTHDSLMEEVLNTEEKEPNGNSEVDDLSRNSKTNIAVDLEPINEAVKNEHDDLNAVKEEDQPEIENLAPQSEYTNGDKIVEIESKEREENLTNEDLYIENATDGPQMAAHNRDKTEIAISKKEDVNIDNVNDVQLEEPTKPISSQDIDENKIPAESLLQTTEQGEVANEKESTGDGLKMEKLDDENIEPNESVLKANTNDEVDNEKVLKDDDMEKDTSQHSAVPSIEPTNTEIETKDPQEKEPFINDDNASDNTNDKADHSIVKPEDPMFTDKVTQNSTNTTEEGNTFENVVLKKMAANDDTKDDLSKNCDIEIQKEEGKDGAQVVEDIIEKSILSVLGDDTLIEVLAKEIMGTEDTTSNEKNEDEIDKVLKEVKNIDLSVEEDILKKTNTSPLIALENELKPLKGVEEDKQHLSNLENENVDNKENEKVTTLGLNIVRDEQVGVNEEKVENIETVLKEADNQSQIVDSSTLEDLNIGDQEKENDEIVDSTSLEDHNERVPNDKIVELSGSSLRDKQVLANVDTEAIQNGSQELKNIIENPKEIEEIKAVVQKTEELIKKDEATSEPTKEQDLIQNSTAQGNDIKDKEEDNETQADEKSLPKELEPTEEQTEEGLIAMPTTLENLNSEHEGTETNSNKLKRSLSSHDPIDENENDDSHKKSVETEKISNSVTEEQPFAVPSVQSVEVESSKELPKETLNESTYETLKDKQLDEENNNDTAFIENMAKGIKLKQFPLGDEAVEKLEPQKEMAIKQEKDSSSTPQEAMPIKETPSKEIGRQQPQTSTTTATPTTIGTQNSPPQNGSKVVSSETSSNEKSKTLPPPHSSSKLSKQTPNPHSSIVDQKIYTDKYMGLPIAEMHLKSFKAVNAMESFPWFDSSKDKKSNDVDEGTKDTTKISNQEVEEKPVVKVLVQETSNEPQTEITSEAKEIPTGDEEINSESTQIEETPAKSPIEYDDRETIQTSGNDDEIKETVDPNEASSPRPLEHPVSIPETERTATYLYGVHKPRITYKPPTAFVIPIEGKKKRGTSESTAQNVPQKEETNDEVEDSIDLETPTKLFEELSAFDYELENDSDDLGKYSLNDTCRMDELELEHPLIVYTSSDTEDSDGVMLENSHDDNDKTSHLSIILELSECESPAPVAADSYDADYWAQLYALHGNRGSNIHEPGKVYNNALENMRQQSEDPEHFEPKNAKEKINYFEEVQNLPHIVKACTTIQHSYRRYAQKRKSVVGNTETKGDTNDDSFNDIPQKTEVKSDIEDAEQLIKACCTIQRFYRGYLKRRQEKNKSSERIEEVESNTNLADSLLIKDMDSLVDSLSPVNSNELLQFDQESTKTEKNQLQVKRPQTMEDLKQFIEACVKIQRFYRRHARNRPNPKGVNLKDVPKKTTPNDSLSDSDLKEFVRACIKIQRFYRRYVKNKPRQKLSRAERAQKNNELSEKAISVKEVQTLNAPAVNTPNDIGANEHLQSMVAASITIQRFYRSRLLNKSNEYSKQISSSLSINNLIAHEEESNDVPTLMSRLPSIPSDDPFDYEQEYSNSPEITDVQHFVEEHSEKALDSTYNVVNPIQDNAREPNQLKPIDTDIIFNTMDIHDLARLTQACVTIQRFYRLHLNKQVKQSSCSSAMESSDTDVEIIQSEPGYTGIHDLAHLTQACVKIQRFYRQHMNKGRGQEAFPKSVESSETENEFIEPHNSKGAMHDLQHFTAACVTIQRFYRRHWQNTNRTQYSRVKQISPPTTNLAVTNGSSAVEVPSTAILHMDSDDVKAIDKLKYLSTCRTSPESVAESQGPSLTESSVINNDTEQSHRPTDLSDLIEACIKIQRFYRRCMATRTNNNTTNDVVERNLKFHQAAITIQQHFRAYLGRQQTAGTINNHPEITATAINDRNASEQLNGEGLAAAVIQNAFRAYMRRRKQLTSEDIVHEQHAQNGHTENANASTHDRNSTNGNNLIAETPETSTTTTSPTPTTKVNWFVGNDPIVPTLHHATDPVPEDSHPLALEVENAESSSSSDAVPVNTLASQLEIVDSDVSPIDPQIHNSLNNLNALNNLEAQGETIGDPKEDQVTNEEMPKQEEKEKERLKREISEEDVAPHMPSYVPIAHVLKEFLEKERANALAQPAALIDPSSMGNIMEIVVKSLADAENLETPIPYEKLPQSQAESNDSLSSLDQQSGSVASTSNTEHEDTSPESSLDTITEKLQNNPNDEIIDKMAKRRASQPKIEGGLENLLAGVSFEEPHIKALQDTEDEEQIVLKHLDSDEQQRLTSADSATVIMGCADEEIGANFHTSPVYKGSFKRLHTIAGGDERSLLKSVTIDETVQYIEASSATSGSSFCLDDDTTAEIRHKMMAYSMSEGDSDFMGVPAMGLSTDDRIPSVSHDDFNISTALVDTTGTSTDTDSTIVSAATKIQAGARGFLARRRLQRGSGGTKSSFQTDAKASFGNAAIDESLERLVEEVAAKKIQTAYRKHYRKNFKAKERPSQMENSLENALAVKRLTLQRGDALRNYSTPDEETDTSDNNGAKSELEAENSEPRSNKSKKTPRERAATVKMATEMRWPAMRQYSMPVQIESEIFRVIPKHKRKRIRSAEADKKGH